ncbi:MAG: peptidoglycan DD-metalloendopeptidase family protein [Lachnospiraceae bacterium]|nr:peptidoglycan DD-metalloendopeptidase family protein [Lachnospiraceae bacterium]
MSKTKNKRSSFIQNEDDLKKHFESDAVDFKNVRDGPKAAIIGSNEKVIKSDADFFAKHDSDDSYRSEYSSQREEMRSRRKRGKYRKISSAKIRKQFIHKEDGFEKETDSQAKTDNDYRSDFASEGNTEIPNNRELERLEAKAEKAAKKTEKARRRLPKRREYRLVKHVDEKTGRVNYELQINKVVKTPKKDTPMTVAQRRALMEAHGTLHQKVAENEKDNSAVEAVHKAEEAAETVVTKVNDFRTASEAAKFRKVAKLEKKQFKAEVNFRYKKHLEANPALKKKAVQKRLQKLRIKREYAKTLRKGSQVKNVAGSANRLAQIATKVAKLLQEVLKKNIGTVATIAFFAMIVLIIAASISSCAAMFNGGFSTAMAGSYQSSPAELDAADEAMSSREMTLQNTVDNIETDHSGYDEYNYNLDEIGHNPFTLINYLSAVNVEFAAADVDGEIQSLFDEMYDLDLTPRTETRTRTVTNPDTGVEEEQHYTVKILDVKLTRKSLEDIVTDRMSGNEEAKGLYEIYQETHGALQQYYTPLDADWYGQVKSYYGYRKNPSTGDNQYHRGIDISVPTGTEVYASQDGTVVTAEYNDDYGNYIVIKDSGGNETKYAHLESINVTAGQTVTHGAIIGKTGDTGSVTGSHLHIECMSGGEYYNPLFYFENGNGSIYGTTDPVGGGGDAAALIAYAEQFLGYPYVWGGSSPSTSFDCSGFVCYVLTHSGYYNMPRTTAQGIYNQCQHISQADARPGDLIFFTKTYNSGNPVTHVGIYAGGGQMLHCGDPIKYSSINTPYWQSHFFGFGRLPGH